MPKSRGFTLIELLVTISIIAILFSIGLMAYSAVLKQGRDSKRQSDIRSIQSALEQYFADQFFYPTAAGLDNAFVVSSPPAFTSSTGNPSSPSPTKTYMNSVPQDPTGTLRYRYETSPDGCDNSSTNRCTSYCLYANLENPGPGRPTSCTTNPSYSFAVTPP